MVETKNWTPKKSIDSNLVWVNPFLKPSPYGMPTTIFDRRQSVAAKSQTTIAKLTVWIVFLFNNDRVYSYEREVKANERRLHVQFLERRTFLNRKQKTTEDLFTLFNVLTYLCQRMQDRSSRHDRYRS
jgi:hypothetical protein